MSYGLTHRCPILQPWKHSAEVCKEGGGGGEEGGIPHPWIHSAEVCWRGWVWGGVNDMRMGTQQQPQHFWGEGGVNVVMRMETQQ